MSRAVGLPVCWDVGRVSDAVTLTAKVGQEQRDYFLATHAPVVGLTARKGFRSGPAALDEARVYEQLMEDWEARRPGQDLSALIHGEAGSGKSHLINWLKLRCDQDRRPEVRAVLVRRRTGSLKDALTQLVEQLGERFSSYLDPVREALGKLSQEAAVRRLLLELSQELGPRRAGRGKPSVRDVDKRLAQLDAACAQVNGFGGWLSRPGGVLDQNVRLLIEGGEVQKRESRPRFTEQDVRPVGAFGHASKNSGDVFELVEELAESPQRRAKAVELLNDSLDPAVAEMTGLSGDNLETIFGKVRRDLQKAGERLVLLVEDVSALSVLDVEIVKAVEPKGDPSLCPMLAVMGVTDAGFQRLRDNDRERITHIAELGGGVSDWADDEGRLAAFTARYLNAVRLSPEEVARAAEGRLEGGDVARSACKECLDRPRCHKAFGSVTLGGVEVGLYPLTPAAPALMLKGMREDRDAGVRPNPRGYLMHLLGPLLGDAEPLRLYTYPGATVFAHLKPVDPADWARFANRYLGDYDDEQKTQARRLLQYWLPPQQNADDAARLLEPLRQLFGLPAFSRKVEKKKPTDTSSATGSATGTAPVVTKPPKPPVATKEEAKLAKLLEGLRKWAEGGTLTDDVEPRRLLAGLVRLSVPWSDLRAVPKAESDRWLKGGDEGTEKKYEAIKIEGQSSRPTGTRNLPDQFPRNEETRALIEALARFEILGGRSWDFPGGELHKRTVSRWLRANGRRLAEKFRPPFDEGKAAGEAASLLALAATVRRRSRVPEPLGEALAEVLRPMGEERRVVRCASWEELPEGDRKAQNDKAPAVVLSKAWEDLTADLYGRHEELLDFLRKELDVPQGDGGTNFIDPGPVLPAVQQAREALAAPAVDPRACEANGFWRTRFSALDRLTGYAGLEAALQAEREAARQIAEKCGQCLLRLGYDQGQRHAALESLAAELAELEAERKKAKLVFNDPELLKLLGGRAIDRHAGWATAMEKATAGLATALEASQFDPRPLLELDWALRTVEAYADRLRAELDEQDRDLNTEGDVDEARDELFAALAELSGEVIDVSADGAERAAAEVAGAEAAGDAPGQAEAVPTAAH